MARSATLSPAARLGAALRPVAPVGSGRPPGRAPRPPDGPAPPTAVAGARIRPVLPWVPGTTVGSAPPGGPLGGGGVGVPDGAAADADEPPTEPLDVLVARPRPAGVLGRLVPVSWRGARLDPGRPAA